MRRGRPMTSNDDDDKRASRRLGAAKSMSRSTSIHSPHGTGSVKDRPSKTGAQPAQKVARLLNYFLLQLIER